MDTVFVKLNVDLKCAWEGLKPDYRIWIDSEMFTERTYQWEDPFYLTEILQIESPDNDLHRVRLEPVGPQLAEFKFENPRVEYCDHTVKIKAISDTEFAFRVKPNED